MTTTNDWTSDEALARRLAETAGAILLAMQKSGLLEGKALGAAGWKLEIERPAIIDLSGAPTVVVDGVQGWRNLALVPD